MDKTTLELVEMVGKLQGEVERLKSQNDYNIEEHSNDVSLLLSYILQVSNEQHFNNFLAHNIAEGNIRPESFDTFESTIEDLYSDGFYPMPKSGMSVEEISETLTDQQIKEYVNYLQGLKLKPEFAAFHHKIDESLAEFGQDEKYLSYIEDWEKKNGLW
jgi:hypothetical protein